MLILLNAALAALRVLYAPCVTDLGSPEFKLRQAAMRTLWNAWPLTHDVCRHAADTTDNPEVRSRAEHVADDRPVRVWMDMMAAPADCWDESVRVMVADEYEQLGLPHERCWMFDLYAGSEAAEAAWRRYVAAGVGAGWIKAADAPSREDVLGWDGPLFPPGCLIGITDVRFRYRGLPTLGEWHDLFGLNRVGMTLLRSLWTAKKAVKR